MRDNGNLPLTWLRFLIVVILVIGIFFRFLNLDRKLYSYDEAITSLRISGYTWTEMVQQTFDGRVISVEDLQKKYQRINPEKSWLDTVKGLAREEAQLPPLYFLLVRFWVQWFGSSVAVTRSLSAFISLLAFPCVYWLCLELFASPLMGWMAIALMAVSPFHVLYAQDARPYILLAVITLLSGAVLLRAVRLDRGRIQSRSYWSVYAMTVVLGLYTHLLFGLIAIGHGIYIVVIEGFRFSKTVTNYFLASFTGFLAFVPWIFAMITNAQEIDDTVGWPEVSKNLLSSFIPLIRLLSRIFVDSHWAGGILDFGVSNIFTNLTRLILTLMLMILIGYSLYFLYRTTSRRIWLFIFAWVGITMVFLVGIGGITERYFFTFFLGIELAVTYLLTNKITINADVKQQKVWQTVVIALLASGVLSCAISSQAQVWSIKYPTNNKYNPLVADIINKASQPLVISQGSNNLTGTILAFSHLLNPKVQLELVAKPDLVKIPDGFSDLFLYKPTKVLRSELKQVHNYKIEPAYKSGEIWLWRLEK